MRVWIQFVISVLLWELFHIKNVLDSFFSIRLLLKRLRSFNPFNQEPITWSEQLPCTRVTALSRTSLFLERFWRECRISFKSHKPVSKTYRPKNNNFCLLMTLRFPFWYLKLRIGSQTWRRFNFRRKNCPKMCLKTNRSVKTPLYRLSMGVAHSGLWAPGKK